MAHVANWNRDIAKKYNLEAEDQPAHIWHIMQNLNGAIKLENVQNVFKYLAGESRKEVRDQFLRSLDYIYFADFWGTFSNHRYGISEHEKPEALKIVKCIKSGFKKYKFKPSSSNSIEYYFSKFGGKVATKKAKFQEGIKKTIKLQKIATADRIPRKMKKDIKIPKNPLNPAQMGGYFLFYKLLYQ